MFLYHAVDDLFDTGNAQFIINELFYKLVICTGSLSIKFMIGYLKKDFKFRFFFLLASISMGFYLYFNLYEDGVFIRIDDIYSFKSVYI